MTTVPTKDMEKPMPAKVEKCLSKKVGDVTIQEVYHEATGAHVVNKYA